MSDRPAVVNGAHSAGRRKADPGSAGELGQSIRTLRLKRGMSLEALAKQTGLSRSGLSKVERGEAVPGTTNLSRIAEALGTTFAAIVSPPTEGEVVVLKADEQPTMVDGETGFSRRCIAPILPSRGLDWVLNTLPRGATTGTFVAHRSGVEEYIYVLEGTLSARLGERTETINAGDALYFQAHVPHEFTASEEGRCRYLLIIDARR